MHIQDEIQIPNRLRDGALLGVQEPSGVVVRDRLWTSKRKLLEGNVKLELFDQRTGRLQERVEKHNYITDIMTGILEYCGRQFFLHDSTGLLVPSSEVAPFPVVPLAVGSLAFWLTDASSAIDTSGDYNVRGTMCAWAETNTYVGSDSFFGTLNVSETSHTPTKDVFVIDWPTNAGNGTIESVYLTAPYTSWGAGLASYAPCYWTTPYTAWADDMTGLSGGTQEGFWLDPDGASYWTLYYVSGASCTLVKRTLGTGAQVTTLTCGTLGGVPVGFTNDGSGVVGNWWIMTRASNNLDKYPAAGAAAPTASYTGLTSYGAVAYGGSHLWVAGQDSLVRQYDPATGGLITTITLGSLPDLGGGFTSLVYQCLIYVADATNGDELWGVGYGSSNTTSNYGFGRWTTSGTGRGFANTGRAISAVSGAKGARISPSGYLIFNSSNNTYEMNKSRQFLARALLPSSVSKSNTQTMKLTYEFDYA